MHAGRLRHRIEIQEPVTEQDATGQPIVTPRTVARRWASVEPLRGQELLRAQQFGSEVTLRVRLRYLAGVKPTWWIKIVEADERTLEIVQIIDPAERHAELELLCKEVS